MLAPESPGISTMSALSTLAGDLGAVRGKSECKKVGSGSPTLAMTNQIFDLSSPIGGSQLEVVTAGFDCDGEQDFACAEVDMGGQYGGLLYVHLQQEHGAFSLSANISGRSPVAGLGDVQH